MKHICDGSTGARGAGGAGNILCAFGEQTGEIRLRYNFLQNGLIRLLNNLILSLAPDRKGRFFLPFNVSICLSFAYLLDTTETLVI